MTPDVLFLAHQADRTGAPLVLLHFLRWLKANTNLACGVLLKQGGELTTEFAAVAPTVLWQDVAPGWRPRLRRLAQRLGIRPAPLAGPRPRFRGVKLLFANTVATGDVLEALGPTCPVVTHVHELDWVIRHYVGAETLAKVRRHTTCYLAVSNAVRMNLLAQGIPEERIRVVYEFIPTRRFASADTAAARSKLLARLGLAADTMLVGAAGEFHWRKGPDLFIQLAATVRRLRPEIPAHFIWLGGLTEGPLFAGYGQDVRQAGLGEHVHFLGRQSAAEEVLAALDVFVLPSREDPFPLVVLEAASCGKPVVCFADAGGAPEFVANDCGFAVPYLDVAALAGRVLDLIESPGLRHRLGACGAVKARQRHDVDVVAPQLLNVIRQYMPGGTP